MIKCKHEREINMKNYEEMKKKKKKSNGIITYSTMIEKGFSKYYIEKLVKEDKCF